jgi:uncharacterized protein (DUF433 family)
MKYKGHIEIKSNLLAGKPVIKGTRISIEFIVELLENGWNTEQILKNYPQLKKEDIFVAIEYWRVVYRGKRL